MTENQEVEKKIMSIVAEDGSVEEVEVILAFEFKDTKKEYVIYSKNEKDENEEQTKIANEIYEKLQKNGIEVIFDDRDERPGVKFKDMELIGIPLRITVGKKITDNLVELRERTASESTDISIDEIVELVTNKVKDSLK